jgi:hypothetical protein
MNHSKVGAVTLIALVQYLGACRCSNKGPIGPIIALMQTVISITAPSTAPAGLI